MRAMAFIICLFFSTMVFAAEKSKQPSKTVRKEAVTKKSTEAKTLPVPESFKVNDRICYRYNPNNPAYFEMIVKSVTDSEIVVSSVLKDAKEVRVPHEEKYTPVEFKEFLKRVHLITCK